MAEAANNDHATSSNMRSSGGSTSNNPNIAELPPGSFRASPLPHPPPVTTAVPLTSVDSSGESVDSFEDSKSSSTSTTSRLRPQVTWSSYQPRNSTNSTTARRERSLSSVVSPYALSRGCTHHQRSSSAVLDLDYSSFEAKAKRRSLSTCGGDSNSVSPPAKAAKSLASDEETTTAYTTSSSSTTSSRPISRTATKLAASTSASKASVRFDESTPPPTKCHHLLSDDEPHQPPQPQAVQRTHSNPEMELCPVCLARKECEILLKRTYSKVIRRTGK